MEKKAKFKTVPMLLFIFWMGICYWGVRQGMFFQSCDDLRAAISNQGWLAPVIYMLLATLGLLFFLPRTFILIMAGLCFGVVWGAIWSLISSMLAALLSFAMTKFYLRSFVEKKLRKRNWFTNLESLTNKSGFYLVLISRAAHVLHFGLLSYAFGVLNVGWSEFLWGTFLGILPGSLILVYSSHSLGCGLWEGKSHLSPEAIYQILFSSLLLVLGALAPLWIKRKK
jgi:uncharacterized membrane protein YdjX (TVP38/TMEM64 family)